MSSSEREAIRNHLMELMDAYQKKIAKDNPKTILLDIHTAIGVSITTNILLIELIELLGRWRT